jgi:hypothetical protein
MPAAPAGRRGGEACVGCARQQAPGQQLATQQHTRTCCQRLCRHVPLGRLEPAVADALATRHADRLDGTGGRSRGGGPSGGSGGSGSSAGCGRVGGGECVRKHAEAAARHGGRHVHKLQPVPAVCVLGACRGHVPVAMHVCSAGRSPRGNHHAHAHAHAQPCTHRYAHAQTRRAPQVRLVAAILGHGLRIGQAAQRQCNLRRRLWP